MDLLTTLFCFLISVPSTVQGNIIKVLQTDKGSDVTSTVSIGGVTTMVTSSTTLPKKAFVSKGSSNNRNKNKGNKNNNNNETSQEKSNEYHTNNLGELKSRDRYPPTQVDLRWNIQFCINDTCPKARERIFLTVGETTSLSCEFTLNRTSSAAGNDIFHQTPQGTLFCYFRLDEPPVCSMDSSHRSLHCRSTFKPLIPPKLYEKDPHVCYCRLYVPGTGDSMSFHLFLVSPTDKGSDVTSTASRGGVTTTTASSTTLLNNAFASNNNSSDDSNNRNNNDINNNNNNNNNETSQEQLSNENHVIYSSGQADVCIDSREDLVDHLDTFWSGNEPFDLDLDPITDVSQPATSEYKQRDN